ncbi:hypothetical protein JT359_20215 [Candidatus Poribacteria bacterium]|nr:hypothetical protein [Candidatus Poribacteria bacterium]
MSKYRIFGYAIATILVFVACSNRNTPQGVTEDFIYQYYKNANQGASLKLCAGRAEEKLQDEIARVQEVRSQDQPVTNMPQIEYKQTRKETSTEFEGVIHELFNYKLTIKSRDGTTTHSRNVVITTENINGLWKVVNFDEYQ